MTEEQDNTEDRILISAMVLLSTKTMLSRSHQNNLFCVRRAVILFTSDPYILLHDKFTALQPLKVGVLWFGRLLR